MQPSEDEASDLAEEQEEEEVGGAAAVISKLGKKVRPSCYLFSSQKMEKRVNKNAARALETLFR